MTLQEVLTIEETLQYQLLSRLESDCKYFLGNGAGHAKHLWANNPTEHIEYMKGIYNNLTEKPEWLSLEQIEKYEQEMGA